MIEFEIKIKEIDQKIGLEDILISANNPRFTILKDIDINLFDFITKKTKLNQIEVMCKLLEYEEDFRDFLDLFKNISKLGFKNQNEEILLLKNPNGEYIVAEGNRRILALKLMGKFLDLKNFDMSQTIISNVDNDYIDIHNINNDYSDNIRKRRNSNIKKMNEIIKNIGDIKFIVHCKSLNRSQSQDIWDFIYEKHLTGERPGIKRWSRGKYYSDLISMFPEGIPNNLEKDLEEKFLKNFKRDPKKIISDFKNAQFVYKIFEYGLDNLESGNVLDHLKKTRVSALEPNFSLNRIKTAARNSMLLTTDDFNSFFDFNFGEKNIISIPKKSKISENDMFKFIFKNSITNKIITTRPMLPKHVDKFESDVMNLFSSGILNGDITNKCIDFFKLSSTLLHKYSNDYREKFEVSKNQEHLDKSLTIRAIANLKSSSSNLIDEIVNIEKVNRSEIAFKQLLKQLHHNEKLSFFNAIACTIRTFYDLLFCYSHLFNGLDNKGNIDEEKISKFKNNICNFMEKYIKNKGVQSFSEIKLRSILTINHENYEATVREIETDWIEDKKFLLNSFIHSPHNIIYSDEFKKNINNLKKWIDNMKILINILDWNKLIQVDKCINQ